MNIPRDKTIIFYPVTLTLIDRFLKTLTLLITFKHSLFYMNIPCDKTFLWVPLYLTLWPCPWSLTHFWVNFNLANNFWTVSARALIYHMSIPCDKTFPWFHNFFKDVLHPTYVIMLCKCWSSMISANYFRNACVKNKKKITFYIILSSSLKL